MADAKAWRFCKVEAAVCGEQKIGLAKSRLWRSSSGDAGALDKRVELEGLERRSFDYESRRGYVIASAA